MKLDYTNNKLHGYQRHKQLADNGLLFTSVMLNCWYFSEVQWENVKGLVSFRDVWIKIET